MKREPWETHPGIWKSKAAFFTYIRGGLRLIWSRYPAKLEWKKTQMVKPPAEYTGRAKSLGKCSYCGEMFAASHLEVDHVAQAGACNSWESSGEFLQNLLDTNGNWVLACKPCHKIKSYAERMGVNFQAALAEKKAIEYSKRPKEEVVAFCSKMGYNAASLSTAKKRRDVLSEIFLNKELNGK